MFCFFRELIKLFYFWFAYYIWFSIYVSQIQPQPFPPIVKTSWYIEIHKVFYQIHLVEKVVFRVFPDLLQFELIDCSLGLPQISHHVTSQ